MTKLVLLRHGESTWNRDNRFTGWTDVPLSAVGEREARKAGQILFANGYRFDQAYTSLLKRAIKTLDLVLEELDQSWIPVFKSWCLNERQYGALQGMDKAEIAAKYGAEQVHIWRRSFTVRPPELEPSDPRFPGRDPRYQMLNPDQLPLAESLEDTSARLLPYWRETIVPAIREGRYVLIAAHGNSLRALVMHLDGISPAIISDLNIPTGIPLVYELESNLKPIRHYYLEEPADIQADSGVKSDSGLTRI